MRQVRLGQTDLKVSAIAFGTWAFGGEWGAADLQEGRDAIHRALELGINLFDTAQGYGFGAAEQLRGDALRQRADDWRSTSPDFTGETFRRNLAVVERLKTFARQRDVSLPQLAVAWTLANPAVQVAIVGARRPSHLDGTASAAGTELSEADLRDIDAILTDAVPMWGPHPEGM